MSGAEKQKGSHALVPMRLIGPVLLAGPEVTGEFMVPLSTYESPLWPSTARGAKACAKAGGIGVVITDDRMSRSVYFEAPDAAGAVAVRDSLEVRHTEIEAVVSGTSRYGRLKDIHFQVVGNLLYMRIAISTGDAAGHNMVTLAADRVMAWVLSEFPSLSYGSISANFCTDKKVSAVNGILGRGKSVVAEVTLSPEICEKLLKTTPEKLASLNTRKNLIGTSLAGGVRSANAHFANILLAFYIATGQDAANIVEGSQGYTLAEVRDGGLYFSVALPHIIVGTVGNGKDLPFVQENLELLGCLESRAPGENARRLAAICGATVLCGELSLLAAQTNPGELMRAHQTLERASS